MFDYTDHKCSCNDKTRAAAREMLQLCKAHGLTVRETINAIEHLQANISYLSLHSPLSVLHTEKESDAK